MMLGLLIPIISSIIPIKVSLDCTLSENLTKTRSKTKGQQVDISSANSFEAKLPYLLFGAIMTIAGIITFYIMPLSLITLNFGLLFEIFYLILM